MRGRNEIERTVEIRLDACDVLEDRVLTGIDAKAV